VAKVLLIEHDPHQAKLIQDYLGSLKCEVWVAPSGESGMAQALEKKPDVILLDGVLPDATGFQMCTRLRGCPETKAIPIIMMSALAQFANQQKFAFERGANEHISKPLKIVELGELVDKYTVSETQKNPPLMPSPGPRARYSLWTQIHQALSDRLRQALSDRDEEKSERKP
jgi:CheY-like chemotaxis protein